MKYKNGELSFAFHETPVETAIWAIRAETGIDVVLPDLARGKVLTLRTVPLPLEAAMDLLVKGLGLHGFAVLYNNHGRAERLIVLDGTKSAPVIAASKVPTPKDEVIIQDARLRHVAQQFQRWTELSQDEQRYIREQLRQLPPSPDRDRLLKQYRRQVWGLEEQVSQGPRKKD